MKWSCLILCAMLVAGCEYPNNTGYIPAETVGPPPAFDWRAGEAVTTYRAPEVRTVE